MQKIRVGIIGLSANGGWGAMSHYPALRALPEYFTLNGLAAGSPASAAAAAAKYGVPYHTASAAALAARDDIDLLVVAVNLPQHRALLESIIPSGKAIYCEWPLGTDPAQSQALTDLADRYHCRTFIGLQAVHSPYVRRLKAILDDAASGTMRSCTILGGDPSRARQTVSRYRYAQAQENGVNTLTIPFAHLLAALRYLFGELTHMAALTRCVFPQVYLADTGETIPRTATDNVLFSGQTADGGLINAICSGALSGLRMDIECDNCRISATGNSGHIQYEPLTITVTRGGRTDTFNPTTAAADNLIDTYRAVHADLSTGSHSVPGFAAAVAHQRLLWQLAGN